MLYNFTLSNSILPHFTDKEIDAKLLNDLPSILWLMTTRPKARIQIEEEVEYKEMEFGAHLTWVQIPFLHLNYVIIRRASPRPVLLFSFVKGNNTGLLHTVME